MEQHNSAADESVLYSEGYLSHRKRRRSTRSSSRQSRSSSSSSSSSSSRRGKTKGAPSKRRKAKGASPSKGAKGKGALSKGRKGSPPKGRRGSSPSGSKKIKKSTSPQRNYPYKLQRPGTTTSGKGRPSGKKKGTSRGRKGNTAKSTSGSKQTKTMSPSRSKQTQTRPPVIVVLSPTSYMYPGMLTPEDYRARSKQLRSSPRIQQRYVQQNKSSPSSWRTLPYQNTSITTNI